MKICRHPAHIALGVMLPWLPVQASIPLVLLFIGYQYLQYCYNTRRTESGLVKDDSFLDIKETAIACGISSVPHLIILAQYIMQGFLQTSSQQFCTVSLYL